ncbi:uracil-DNA glycosylase [Gammaproteobacteria bacterium]
MGIAVWEQRRGWAVLPQEFPPSISCPVVEAENRLSVMENNEGEGEEIKKTVEADPFVYGVASAGEIGDSRLSISTVPVVSSVEIPTTDWDRLERTVKECTACPLHRTRTQSVFGVGNRAAKWFIVGEAPGEDEDRQGEPFVGRAGQLLDLMLKGIGLQREEVYIANVLKSRPPGNRTPLPEEIATCGAYLERQIELVRPQIILATGAVAAQKLLASTTAIGLLRGRIYRYGTHRIPLVVTYHPSYLLRSPHEKRKAWDDLRLAWRVFHRAPPDGQDL